MKYMTQRLFYVAPKESMEFILESGILIPNEVNRLIKAGELPKEVLGVSYGMDSSNFPEHVSLLENIKITKSVAEQICFAKTGTYNDPNFMAIGYAISPEIREHKEFIPNEEVKKMHSEPYHSEVLYHGNIPKEFIREPVFAVRTYRW